MDPVEVIRDAVTGQVTTRPLTPEEIAARVPVPPQITKIQFVRAMRALDLWDTHKATIEGHPDWPYITEVPRGDPLTLAAAAVMDATPEQMDAIWILGATL